MDYYVPGRRRTQHAGTRYDVPYDVLRSAFRARDPSRRSKPNESKEEQVVPPQFPSDPRKWTWTQWIQILAMVANIVVGLLFIIGLGLSIRKGTFL